MDYVVIGAGPAGLPLGYLLRRAGRDHEVYHQPSRAFVEAHA